MKDELKVFDLRTENLKAPIGIDALHPRFSWKIASTQKDCCQSAYRIVVTDQEEKAVWDSGRVFLEKQNEIVYEGQPLRSMTAYQWRVQVWNEQGEASSWSEGAVFETGIFSQEEWQGKWITHLTEEDPLEGISWIHAAAKPGEWVEFSCTLKVEAPLQQAFFDGTGYEAWEIFCNGRFWRKMNTEWKQDYQALIRYGDLAELLQEGENELRIRVRADQNGMAALIGRILLREVSGKETTVCTDPEWKLFKDEREENAQVLGTYGIAPFGKLKRRGPSPLLRKEFELSGKIARARLYVCGLGYAHCTVNGEAASDSLLGTEYSQYHKSVYYRTFDVTSLLKEGKNCLGAELGRGHYSFGQDWIGTMEEQDSQKLLLLLKVWYPDGSIQTIVSDETWKGHDGATVDDNLWYGEKYDAGRLVEDWEKPGFDDRTWEKAVFAEAPKGKLRAASLPPIRVKEELKPVGISTISKTIRVYDFGKVTAGSARICVREPKGTRIRLTYGETLLPNGRVDMESPNKVIQLWEPGQVDTYLCAGDGEEIWSAKFTYKGYRYIEVEGVDHEISLTGLVFHNDLEVTGEFSCSNELFNRIHGLVTPTILNNFHSIPTDTPAYEKRGWTGDAQSICDTALLNLDAQPFFEKWLQDLCDSQRDDGAIPDTCPGPLYYPEAPEWMCAMVVLPYQLYKYCGNQTILRKCYPHMERYMAYETGRLEDGMSFNRFYGDWNSPAGARPPEGTAYNATCFVYYCLKLMEEISDVLGEDENAEHYRKTAEAMKNILNERFFDEEASLYHGDILCGFRQTPSVLPLAFGIAPEEKRKRIARSLAEHIHSEDKDHLSTGCMGLKFLAPVLTEYGQAETAYRIVNQTDFPSWGYWLSLGATTCWEEWTTKTRSVDHFYFGTIDDWFYRYLAGIRPLESGYHRFLIEPSLCGELTEVKASVETPYGEISVCWKRTETQFQMTVEVPVNTTAVIKLPNGERCVKGSGKHEFLVTLS